MDEPGRKDIRLGGWDYSSHSCYHVTICTRDRLPILGTVVDAGDLLAAPYVELSPVGRCCKEVLEEIAADTRKARLLNYVVMPNHVHLLVWIRADVQEPVSLQGFVRFFKSRATNAARRVGVGEDLWQKSFYDVIVRDDEMLNAVWEYIDGNPAKWADDEYHDAPSAHAPYGRGRTECAPTGDNTPT